MPVRRRGEPIVEADPPPLVRRTIVAPRPYTLHLGDALDPPLLCGCYSCHPEVWCRECIAEAEWFSNRDSEYHRQIASIRLQVSDPTERKMPARQLTPAEIGAAHKRLAAIAELLAKRKADLLETMLHGDGQPRQVVRQYRDSGLCLWHGASKARAMPPGTQPSAARKPGLFERLGVATGVISGSP